MPMAARVGDPVSHGGVVGPPGAATVLIGGKPAATLQSQHLGPACPAHDGESPCPTAFLPIAAVATVLIGGAPALVQGGSVVAPCGASIVVGAPTVLIGG